jgi:hypothetical protein
MDLKKFDTKSGAEQGYELVLLDPAGTQTDAAITLRGADSDTYQRKLREHQRRRLDQLNRTRKVTQSPEAIESEAIELMVAATIGWRGIERDEVEVSFSGDAARALYTEFPAIREQVDQAINERANFLPKAASGS